jgi:hypothetical protein
MMMMRRQRLLLLMAREAHRSGGSGSDGMVGARVELSHSLQRSGESRRHIDFFLLNFVGGDAGRMIVCFDKLLLLVLSLNVRLRRQW